MATTTTAAREDAVRALMVRFASLHEARELAELTGQQELAEDLSLALAIVRRRLLALTRGR